MDERANVSLGGDSFDVSLVVHPSYYQVAIAALNSIPGLSYGAVDFITKDMYSTAEPGNYIIGEIECNSGLTAQYITTSATGRDLTRAFLLHDFPHLVERKRSG